MFGFSTISQTPLCALPEVGGVSYNVFITESLNAVSLVNSTIVLPVSIFESGSVNVSSIFVQGTYNPEIVESLNLVDQINGGLSYISVINESIFGSAQVSSIIGFASQIDERTNVFDNLIGAINFVASIQENTELADSIQGLPFYRGYIDEQLAASESVSKFASFSSNVQETVGLPDPSITPQIFINIVIYESAGVRDQNVANVNFLSYAVEKTDVVGIVDAFVDFNVVLQEFGVVRDSVLGRFIWELINDSQTQAWQNIGTDSNPVWALITSDGSSNWNVIVADSQGGWSVQNNSDDPDWKPIKTLN